MKRKLLLICTLACLILAIFACKKDENSFGSVVISKFELIPETNTAPANVLVVYEFTIKDKGEISYYFPGGTCTNCGISSSGFKEFFMGDSNHKDTLKLFYANSGTYEVRLDVKYGNTYSKNFTLTEAN